MLQQLNKDIQKLADKKRAETSAWFFKTGKGEYGESDKFIGVTVPNQRKVAKKYHGLPLNDIQKLLESGFHEHRLVAVFILVDIYKKTDNKKEIIDFFMKNTKNINNWDLVDSCAYKILGNYLLDKEKSILYKLAKSKNIWERRIAIISTMEFIAHNKFDDALKISEILLNDKHDLIHKAVGWMLKEIGKRDQQVEESFLKKHYREMPRTMLRYAIEKFDEKKRKFYMKRS